eukprot:1839909-Rhodomonas_salina.6
MQTEPRSESPRLKSASESLCPEPSLRAPSPSRLPSSPGTLDLHCPESGSRIPRESTSWTSGSEHHYRTVGTPEACTHLELALLVMEERLALRLGCHDLAQLHLSVRVRPFVPRPPRHHLPRTQISGTHIDTDTDRDTQTHIHTASYVSQSAARMCAGAEESSDWGVGPAGCGGGASRRRPRPRRACAGAALRAARPCAAACSGGAARAPPPAPHAAAGSPPPTPAPPHSMR